MWNVSKTAYVMWCDEKPAKNEGLAEGYINVDGEIVLASEHLENEALGNVRWKRLEIEAAAARA
tara:strand:+ start:1168 stop:1359 length:192 start_codon:yes stop_codon:yes gene_type:complete